MNYPHWFTILQAGQQQVPCAVMLISEAQADCEIRSYVKRKNYDGHVDPLVRYESLDELLEAEGLTKGSIVVLTYDDRGKSIAFTYCDEPGGRCGVDYYESGCFI